MTTQEFKDLCREKVGEHDIQSMRMVEGKMSNSADRAEANFNGVYALICGDKVVYVGSAYPSSFPIKKRLGIHYNAHPSNSCFAKKLINEGKTREKAKEYIGNLNFVAIEQFSLEYYLIENIEGLVNVKGYKRNKGKKP